MKDFPPFYPNQIFTRGHFISFQFASDTAFKVQFKGRQLQEEERRGSGAGLPDRLFSNQKYQLWVNFGWP
jgi:hypothetical protein